MPSIAGVGLSVGRHGVERLGEPDNLSNAGRLVMRFYDQAIDESAPGEKQAVPADSNVPSAEYPARIC